MAKQTEEAILQFKLEQQGALNDLDKLKQSVVSNRIELNELNKAFKAGDITLEEYSKEAVRVETILKRQTIAYNSTQKAVTGHKSKIDELIKSNKNLSSSVLQASENISIGGQSIGGLTTKLASLATPLGAAVGLVSALGAAYANSTVGAKDLEFAQNQLAAATQLVSDSFAELISSSEDGEGFFSQALFAILLKISPEIAIQSKLVALATEKLEALGRKEIEIRGDISERLTENQEKLTKIADAQTLFSEKLKLSNDIVTNLKTNQNELLGVLKQELSQLQIKAAFFEKDEKLKTIILLKEKEINKVTADTTKKIEAQRRSLGNIQEIENKRLSDQASSEVNAFVAAKAIADPNKVGIANINPVTIEETFNQKLPIIFDARKQFQQDLTRFEQQQAIERGKNRQLELEGIKRSNEELLANSDELFNSLAGLFDQGSEAQKGFVLLSIATNTAEAIGELTAASEGNPFNSVTLGGAGIGQFISGLARIFANIATAKRFLGGFAEGGWTGPGEKYKAVGVVHADEYVAPKKVVNNPMAQPHLRALEAMRGVRGYADGGFVANTNIISGQTALATINAIKRLPIPEVSVVEISRKQKAINIRERTARIGGV